MKICAFCQSENPFDAKICRVCGRMLDAEKAMQADVRTTGVFMKEGDVLGERYEILELIGQGGMGRVYKALDRKRRGEVVAIKVLSPDIASDQRAIEDMITEANVTMKLSHDHIMRLHNYEEGSGYKFLVMEFIEGPTLERVLAERTRLTEDEVVLVALQICEGLQYAHSKGVVHRDLKPSNFMITQKIPDLDRALLTAENCAIRITDFGIARIAKDSKLRITGKAPTGTLLYMSPEQIKGKAIDARSDIYSVGCVLYELLNGRPPFHTGDVATQHLSEAPKQIPEVSEWFNSLILKCLEKDPEKRWSGAKELSQSIKAREKEKVPVVTEEPEKPITAEKEEKVSEPAVVPVREMPRRPSKIVLPLLLGLLVCVLALLVFWPKFSSLISPQQADEWREWLNSQIPWPTEMGRKTEENKIEELVQWFKQGKDAYLEKDWQTCKISLGHAIAIGEKITSELNPEKFAEAYQLRAEVALIENEVQDAKEYLTKAINLDDKSEIRFYLRGRANLTLGQYENAISDFTSSLDIKPNYANAYLYRGDAYKGMKKYEDARSDYIQAKNLGLVKEAESRLDELDRLVVPTPTSPQPTIAAPTFTQAPIKVPIVSPTGAIPTMLSAPSKLDVDECLKKLAALEAPAGAFKVSIWTDKKKFKPGDTFSFYCRVERDCYLWLLDIGTSGEIKVLFPSGYYRYSEDKRNFVPANTTITFPPADIGSVEVTADSPAGIERVVAIATTVPYDLFDIDFTKQQVHTVDKINYRGFRDLRLKLQNLEQGKIQHSVARIELEIVTVP